MTPEETARAAATATARLASWFMLDGETYKHGATLGFEGLSFYFAGRGGVLGDVDADVVSAAFVFFNPETVRSAWEASAKVMARHEAAQRFAECGYTWAQARFPGDLDAARLAELAGKAAHSANPAGAPVFAGWRALPEPSEPNAAALHHMNALRELRMASHAAAVLAAGVAPADAVRLHTPYMAAIFGWNEPVAPDAPAVDFDAIEAATDCIMARAFVGLDDAERAEFAELANHADASVA